MLNQDLPKLASGANRPPKRTVPTAGAVRKIPLLPPLLLGGEEQDQTIIGITRSNSKTAREEDLASELGKPK